MRERYISVGQFTKTMQRKREATAAKRTRDEDQEFERQLRELGWKDEGNGEFDLLGADFAALSADLMDSKEPVIDFTTLGEIDESKLQLSEDDFNDASLEAQLA